eukprot:scaffold11749_cov77-Cyclotella_meneghiniana.AAC.5
MDPSISSSSMPSYYGATATTDDVITSDTIECQHSNENQSERRALKAFVLCSGLLMLSCLMAAKTANNHSVIAPSMTKENSLVSTVVADGDDDDSITSSLLTLKLESPICDCLDKPDSPCKSLLLLRHAKSSYKNSFFINDIDRHLSNSGIKVAQNVGHELHHMKMKLPNLILSSPSIRSEETLNLVLGEWLLGEVYHHHLQGKRNKLKIISNGKHHKLIKALEDNHVEVRYEDGLYKLSDKGYLPQLANMIGTSHSIEPNRVMIVGHNPAIEELLNQVTSSSHQQTFEPGEIYEICLPGLVSWNDLAEQRVGAVSIALNLKDE